MDPFPRGPPRPSPPTSGLISPALNQIFSVHRPARPMRVFALVRGAWHTWRVPIPIIGVLWVCRSYDATQARASPRSFDSGGGGIGFIRTQNSPTYPPKFSFSSDFGHFILKTLENTKHLNISRNTAERWAEAGAALCIDRSGQGWCNRGEGVVRAVAPLLPGSEGGVSVCPH